MKETRKQKIARQQIQRDAAAGRAADRAFKPIQDAIDRGDLVVGPAPNHAIGLPRDEADDDVLDEVRRRS